MYVIVVCTRVNGIAALQVGVIQALLDYVEGVLIWKKKDLGKLGRDIILNSAANLAGNFLGSKMIKIGKTWFQPKHFKSIFTGSFGQKLIQQTGMASILNSIITWVRNKLDI
jgi:hypothetical protein